MRNGKGKAVEALPFIEWSFAMRFMRSSIGAQMNLPAASNGVSTGILHIALKGGELVLYPPMVD
jgi:hypothetical protein